MPSFSSIESFYLKQTEPHRSCLLALREIILKQDDELTETTKYGMPCFVRGKKILCYLWLDKKSGMPYILMVDGGKIVHPDLVAGNRAKMKVLFVDPNTDLEIDKIQEVLQLGLGLF